MKHIELFFLIFTTFLCNCSDKYSEELGLQPMLTPRYINVSPQSLSFFALPTTSQSVRVESFDTPWKIDNAINWITLSSIAEEKSGNVRVTASENENGDKVRVGIFYVKSNIKDWDYESAIYVSQAAATPFIKVSKSELFLQGNTSRNAIEVSTNCNFSISGGSEWLSITQEGNNIILDASANETQQYRNTTIILYTSENRNISTTISVTQAPAYINASTSTLSFDYKANNTTIGISSDANWTATASHNWINIYPQNGDVKASSLTISVSPNNSVNERTGYVALFIGNNERFQISIKQQGIYLKTNISECDFEASACTKAIQVTSNAPWEISNLPSWITVDKINGEGNSDIRITAEENPNSEERTGEFTISPLKLTAQTTVKVRQEGKSLNIATSKLLFSDKQETQSVSITTNGTWEATTSCDWITLSSTSGDGNSVLYITVSENQSEDERNGSVIIKTGNISTSVAITQKSKYFTINNSSLNFTSKGGQLSIEITTNTVWTAQKDINADWISITPQNGSGSKEFIVAISDNPFAIDRSANIYFNALGKTIKIVIKQNKAYIKTNTNGIMFYSKGGVSETVTVASDREFDIRTSGSWFQVNRVNNTFTVTASENDTNNERSGLITILATDLENDFCSITIPVTQLCKGGTFIRQNYNDDEDYDTDI